MDDLAKHCQILGLNPDYSADELEEAFQERAEAWNPDRFAHNEQLRAVAREKLGHVHAAHQFLSARFSGPAIPSTPPPTAQFDSASQRESVEAAVRAGKRAAFRAVLAALILILLAVAWLIYRHPRAVSESGPVPAPTNAAPRPSL